MKKEAWVIRDMSASPENEQVQFWHEEFVPLLGSEHALRERLALAGQKMSSESTAQQDLGEHVVQHNAVYPNAVLTANTLLT
jgi:hypothetical protein